jgi:hypothetical protein
MNGKNMHSSTPRFDSAVERFGETLRQSLKRKYGKLPSAGFVAREFNLRCTNTHTITNETARRWMRGCTLPDYSRLEVFGKWLEIDYNLVFANQGGSDANATRPLESAVLDTEVPVIPSDPVIRKISLLPPQQKAALYDFVKFLPLQAPAPRSF